MSINNQMKILNTETFFFLVNIFYFPRRAKIKAFVFTSAKLLNIKANQNK